MRHAHCTPIKQLNWRTRQALLERKASELAQPRATTWWMSEEARQTRDGFTALARQHVRVADPTIYKFREQAD